MRIVLIGLGLIGGSLGLALRESFPRIGVDIDAETRGNALRAGAVDQAVASAQEIAFTPEDLVVLCLHPEGCLDWLDQWGGALPPGAVVTDVCGIKAPITRRAKQVLPPGVPFVGGHPMAGREKGGFANATATLFQGAQYLMSPGDAPSWAVERVREMIRPLGAHLHLTDPETHDRLIAYTSQMMHILALAACEQESLMPSLGYEGGSFAGATRVAALDVSLWMQLFWPNREPLAGQVQELIGKLEDYLALLRGADEGALGARIRQAVARKEAYNAERDRRCHDAALRDFD